MSDEHHDHEHHEDPSVCFNVAVIFVGVIVAVFIIGILPK